MALRIIWPFSATISELNSRIKDFLDRLPDAEKRWRTRRVTGTVTWDYADDVLVCDGTFTVTLPSAQAFLGRVIHIKNWSGTTTVAAAGSDLIDGAASINFTAKASRTLVACLTGSSTYGWAIL